MTTTNKYQGMTPEQLLEAVRSKMRAGLRGYIGRRTSSLYPLPWSALYYPDGTVHVLAPSVSPVSFTAYEDLVLPDVNQPWTKYEALRCLELNKEYGDNDET